MDVSLGLKAAIPLPSAKSAFSKPRKEGRLFIFLWQCVRVLVWSLTSDVKSSYSQFRFKIILIFVDIFTKENNKKIDNNFWITSSDQMWLIFVITPMCPFEISGSKSGSVKDSYIALFIMAPVSNHDTIPRQSEDDGEAVDDISDNYDNNSVLTGAVIVNRNNSDDRNIDERLNEILGPVWKYFHEI